MTTIDGARLPGRIPNVPGATLELLELESVRTGRSRGELVALAVAAMFAPPIEDPAPLGEAPGQGTTRPPAPVIDGEVVPFNDLHHTLELVEAERDRLKAEVADAAAMQEGLAAFAKLAAKRHADADRAVKRHQDAGDMEWADLCATRRVWAEVVRLVGQIEGSA